MSGPGGYGCSRERCKTHKRVGHIVGAHAIGIQPARQVGAGGGGWGLVVEVPSCGVPMPGVCSWCDCTAACLHGLDDVHASKAAELVHPAAPGLSPRHQAVNHNHPGVLLPSHRPPLPKGTEKLDALRAREPGRASAAGTAPLHRRQIVLPASWPRLLGYPRDSAQKSAIFRVTARRGGFSSLENAAVCVAWCLRGGRPSAGVIKHGADSATAASAPAPSQSSAEMRSRNPS
jgi:hypothetical protein